MMVHVRALLRRTLVCALPAAALCAAEPSPVANAQALVTQWAKIRQETIRLESQWAAEKDLLASLEATLDSRRQALADQKRILLAQTSDQRRAHEELASKNSEAKAGLARAEAQVLQLSATLAKLRPRLPPRLSRGLEMAFRSLSAPDLPLAERSQFLVTVLNRCAQFNQAISCGEEPVMLADGERLLEVAYWGLTGAYALDRASGHAYVGGPEADGWHWHEKPGIAPAVVSLLAQARDKADPAFVELPVQVKTRPATTSVPTS